MGISSVNWKSPQQREGNFVLKQITAVILIPISATVSSFVGITHLVTCGFPSKSISDVTRKTFPCHNIIMNELNDLITDLHYALQWRHNEREGVSNHQPHNCLLNRLFKRRSKKTSKFRATVLCAGNSPLTGEFPAQMASNAENVSIWWRHHRV